MDTEKGEGEARGRQKRQREKRKEEKIRRTPEAKKNYITYRPSAAHRSVR